MGPNTLKKCIVNTSTSDQYNISNDNTKQSTAEDYFRTNLFYTLMDVVITNFKKRSPESLMMASSIDHFFNLNFNDSIHFINYYHVNT